MITAMKPQSYRDIARRKTRKFTKITDKVLHCLKRKARDHNITYPKGDQGNIIIKVPVVGKVVLDFVRNPETNTITLTIKEKPMLVTRRKIWNQIATLLNECKSFDPRLPR